MREHTRLCRFTRKAGYALALCAALCASTWSDNAFAQVTALSSNNDMKFGKAAGDADISGTIVLNTSSQKSFTGGAYDMGDAPISAQFKLLGDDGTAYSCSFPASIQLSNGGNTMTMDSFTTSPALTGTIGGSGEVFIDVGATLHLASGQAAADYSGSLTLTCNGQQGSLDVFATIYAPISISSSGSLEFGTAEPTGVAGTVTINPNGTRTASNVILWASSVSAVTFNVSGFSSEIYAITLPSSATLTGPSGTMTVDTFTHDAGGSPALSSGSDTFNVGATLHVGATQPPGLYTGTFAVTVGYN